MAAFYDTPIKSSSASTSASAAPTRAEDILDAVQGDLVRKVVLASQSDFLIFWLYFHWSEHPRSFQENQTESEYNVFDQSLWMAYNTSSSSALVRAALTLIDTEDELMEVAWYNAPMSKGVELLQTWRIWYLPSGFDLPALLAFIDNGRQCVWVKPLDSMYKSSLIT